MTAVILLAGYAAFRSPLPRFGLATAQQLQVASDFAVKLPEGGLSTDKVDQRRQQHGRAFRDYDGVHAVLLVREAPRIGSKADNPGLRKLLEARNLAERSPTGKIVFATDHFIMDSVTEADTERFTPVYNLRRTFVQTSSASGRTPRQYSYSGRLLINGREGSQFASWQMAWNDWLRATTCLMNGQRQQLDLPYVVELRYRDQIRRGYLTGFQRIASSATPGETGFGFSMFSIHDSVGVPANLPKQSGFDAAVADADQSATTTPVTRPTIDKFF